MIRDPEHEQMPRADLERLQLERLKLKVSEVYNKVPFYRRAFKEKGVTPDDIKTLADLSRLPFTSKLDFRDNYPYGLMMVPLEQVVRIHASSGTTGKPVIAPYTQHDIDTWSEIMARSLATAGTTKDDILQNAYGYGLFTGGLGFHYGAERLGAMAIPTSSGNTKRQLLLLQDLGTTVITCTPSYALILHETARDMGIDLRDTRLRLGVLGAEPWSEQMRRDIEDRLGITAINIYGLTEVIGPEVSVECPYKCGMHIAEDHFLVETIDPESGEMLIVKGINVFPSQIESVLLDVEGVEPHYLIVVDRQHAFKSDELEIWVEVSEQVFSDEMQKMEGLEKRLRSEMDSVLGISASIKLVEPRTIERTEGKAKRVVDRSEL